MKAEPLIYFTRGTLAESIHQGHIAVVRSIGERLYSAGDPGHLTFARSAAKPLQAIPVLESGAAERFHFTDREIALLCSSHNGEPEHAETVAGLLSKLDLGPGFLKCGSHEPFSKQAADELKKHRKEPSALHNNCSGKHSGMLAMALMLEAPLDSYLEIGHPVQQRNLLTISSLSGVPKEEIGLGIDGCGVPVFALPLEKLALAYARFGDSGQLSEKQSEASQRILSAIRKEPFYLAGTDRFDTALVQVTNGRILGKLGAEGVFAVTVPDERLGIAVKIEDGNPRGLYPAVVETLRQLDLLTSAELQELEPFHRPVIRNWQGTVVGATVPSFTLQKA